MKKAIPAFDEGPAAFERFRDAVKKIITVPKDVVVRAEQKARTARKRRTKR